MGRGKAWTTQEDNALRQLVTALTPSIKHLRDVGAPGHPGSRAILTGIQDFCQEEGHAHEQHVTMFGRLRQARSFEAMKNRLDTLVFWAKDESESTSSSDFNAASLNSSTNDSQRDHNSRMLQGQQQTCLNSPPNLKVCPSIWMNTQPTPSWISCCDDAPCSVILSSDSHPQASGDSAEHVDGTRRPTMPNNVNSESNPVSDVGLNSEPMKRQAATSPGANNPHSSNKKAKLSHPPEQHGQGKTLSSVPAVANASKGPPSSGSRLDGRPRRNTAPPSDWWKAT